MGSSPYDKIRTRVLVLTLLMWLIGVLSFVALLLLSAPGRKSMLVMAAAGTLLLLSLVAVTLTAWSHREPVQQKGRQLMLVRRLGLFPAFAAIAIAGLGVASRRTFSPAAVAPLLLVSVMVLGLSLWLRGRAIRRLLSQGHEENKSGK